MRSARADAFPGLPPAFWGRVRRARLYYLRELQGKAARLKGTREGAEAASAGGTPSTAPEAAEAAENA